MKTVQTFQNLFNYLFKLIEYFDNNSLDRTNIKELIQITINIYIKN